MGVTDVYDKIIAEVERPLIRLTLAATRGNQIKAASMLGLNRNTLRKKIRDLEIPGSTGPDVMISCGLMVGSAKDGSRPGLQEGAKTVVIIAGLPRAGRNTRWRPI